MASRSPAPSEPSEAPELPGRAATSRARGRRDWLVPAVITGSLAPLGWLFVRAARDGLGADPIARALNELGLLALLLLVLCLACTPLRIATGAAWPIRVRKALGNLAFLYASLHVGTYAVIDQGGRITAIVADVTERPFLAAGAGALFLLVPLAATSSARAVKRLGHASWKRLHRLVYLAAALAVLHFVLRVKKDLLEPALYGGVVALLLLVRIVDGLRRRRGAGPRARAPARAGSA